MYERLNLSSGKQAHLTSHMSFIIACTLAFMALFTGLRLSLMLFNQDLTGTIPGEAFIEAFVNGARFDLRVIAFILLPMILAMLSMRAMRARLLMRFWLTACASITTLLGIIELNFGPEHESTLKQLYAYLQVATAGLLSQSVGDRAEDQSSTTDAGQHKPSTALLR